jgi:hypothetical protein
MRACDAGSALGPEIARKGAIWFVGYCQPVMFLHQPEHAHEPLKDDLAAPVLECSNQVGISLIKGQTAREAHENSIKMYQARIDELSSSKYANTYILPFLHWNMTIQVCY